MSRRAGVLIAKLDKWNLREDDMTTVSMTVNGKAVSQNVEGRKLLSALLRDDLRMTGTHIGCDTSQCGACVVHVNGQAVKSCTMSWPGW